VNRDGPINLKCYVHWVDIAEALGREYFVLADDETLISKIVVLHRMLGKPMPRFLDTLAAQKGMIAYGLERIPTQGALYTPFIHARDAGYKRFWNIDADDTCIFALPESIANLLLCAEKYADDSEIHLFSFDMWHSRLFYEWYDGQPLKHPMANIWTFGVCLVNNAQLDYIKYLKPELSAEVISATDGEQFVLDNYLGWCRTKKYFNIETWYADGLWFDHVGNSVSCHADGLYRLRGRDLPIAADCVELNFAMKNLSSYKFKEYIYRLWPML
jgi:hypothetical protein